MARLGRLPARLGRLAPRVARADLDEAARSRRRDRAEPWRAWYKTAAWRRLRWSVLLRDGFACAACGGIFADSSRLVCDHVEDHKGDWAKFWAGPFQTLCATCHGAKVRTRNVWGGG